MAHSPLSQSLTIFFDLLNDPIQQASFFLQSPVNSVINRTLYYKEVLNNSEKMRTVIDDLH